MLFDRTFHPDEANQAFAVGKLLETGSYTYNPADHHGPTLYYAAAPVQKLCGATGTSSLEEIPLRSVPLAFAVLTLVFAFLAARRLIADQAAARVVPCASGRAGRATLPWILALLAVLPLATLPILFFFSTYFIQETLFGCFLAGMFWCGVEYFHAAKFPGRVKPGTWAMFLGVFAGLAFATKETSVIAFLSTAVAAAPFAIAARKRKKEKLFPEKAASHAVIAATAGLLTSVLLFSSFATNWAGVYAAFIEAPLSYIGRAGGSAASEGAADHVHEWWWYLKVLFGYPIFNCRWLGALFLVGLAGAYRRPSKPVAFVSLYAVASLAVYSLVPYKTPWCMLTVAEAMAFAAGLNIVVAGEGFSLKQVLTMPMWRRLVCSPLLHMALLALTVVTQYFLCEKIARYQDNPMIPYNYANASWDVRNAAEFAMRKLAEERDPEAYAAVCLPAEDTWPLPWYLRKSKAGYWQSIDALPLDLPKKPAVVILGDDDSEKRMEMRFPELNGGATYGIRPGVLCTVRYKDKDATATKEACEASAP